MSRCLGTQAVARKGRPVALFHEATHASSRQGLKYAQGYSLFLYLMVGDGGRYLPTFIEYLKAALRGKGQASTFRKLFRKDLDRIEKGHRTVS